jgi:hypothetical protein
VTGPVLVVSGSLVGRSDAAQPIATLRVQLVDARGEPLAGASARAGLALDEARLREERPARLREELERSARLLAGRSVAPGERVEIQALFDEVPAAAAGFVLEEDRP